VDTTTAYGRAVFGILAVVAALERELDERAAAREVAYKKEKEGKPRPRPRIKFTVAETSVAASRVLRPDRAGPRLHATNSYGTASTKSHGN